MKKNTFLLSLLAVILFSGCSSSAQRMAECQAQGISRDACYIAEQNRKTSINTAAEKQAMENAQARYPLQHAQAAARSHKTWKGFGVTVERHADGLVYVDSKPAVIEETTEKAKVYQQGLYLVIIYNSDNVRLMKDKVYIGELR